MTKKGKPGYYLKYLHPTAEDKQWGIYLTSIGHDQGMANYDLWNKGRLQCDYYLLFFTAGLGRFCTDTENVWTIRKDTCVFLSPYLHYSLESLSDEGLAMYWVSFSGDFVTKLIQDQFNDRSNACIYVNGEANISAMFNEMIHRVQRPEGGYQQQLAGLLLQLLGEL